MSKIKVALIGAGNIANTHLASYEKNKDVEIAAICDINEKRLNETADKFGIQKRYTDVDSMLKDNKDLDAADVCVWNCNHAECSIKALNAGLHVMCEKPMAYNAKQAEEMIAAAKRNGKLLMIGFVLRFSDEGRIAKDFVDKGYLGDIYYSKAQYLRSHGNPGGWFSDKSRSGGGPVIDLGVHVIDLTRYLMGNPKPVSVYAQTYQNLGKRDYLKTRPGWVPRDASPDDISDVEDFAIAIIKYDNGAVTQLETSYDYHGEVVGKKALYGTKGGMDLSSGVKIYTETNDFISTVEVDTKNYKLHEEMFDAEINHFVDCVKNGTECRAKAEDGVEVMKILDAIYLSSKTGHEVVIED
jgi:predicted dehydrogenase